MKRKLTDEERRLWANAMRTVRPLPPGRAPSEPRASEMPATNEVKRRLAHAVLEPNRPPHTGPRPTPALVPLPRRDKQRLGRGHLPIDARLDLHGMTQTEAHAALARFLGSAQAGGAQFVLVITGTGARGAIGERGVLRRQVPLWLHLPEFRPYVVGFESAHVGHGGEGALYIRLRRLRPKVV
jgi:DNA-nicking Smr family endonuclease